MNLFSRFKPASAQSGGVLSVLSSSGKIQQDLRALRFEPTYIAGFVSPHVDLDRIARAVAERFPQAAITLCTTSGELCSQNNQLYCATGNQWDRVVLQMFDASIIASAETVYVPLESQDIRARGPRMSMQQRIAKLIESIKRLRVNTTIDPSRYLGLRHV